jgi:hypothetical protein
MKPYMVAAGNHEANCLNGGYKKYNESICPIGQTNFTGARRVHSFEAFSYDSCLQTILFLLLIGFINRFGKTMPSGSPTFQRRDDHPAAIRGPPAASLALPPFWYSFDYGMTHFVMFGKCIIVILPCRFELK